MKVHVCILMSSVKTIQGSQLLSLNNEKQSLNSWHTMCTGIWPLSQVEFPCMTGTPRWRATHRITRIQLFLQLVIYQLLFVAFSVFPHQEAQNEGGGSVHTPQTGPLSHLSAAIHQICDCSQNRPVLGNFCDSPTKFHY